MFLRLFMPNAICMVEILHNGHHCRSLKICSGGSIFTMEINKCYKPGTPPHPHLGEPDVKYLPAHH